VTSGDPPADVWEREAVYRGLWSDDPALSMEAWRQLGRRAGADGWAWRLLSDVLDGRLSVDPAACLPSLREILRHAPDLALGILGERAAEGSASRPPSPAAAVVAIAIGREGRHGLDRLRQLAQHRDVSLRLAATAGLAELAAQRCEGAVEALAAQLNDPKGEVRWAAASALGRARGRSCAEQAAVCLERAAAGGDDRAAAGAAFGAAALSAVLPARMMQVLREIVGSGPAGRRAVASAMCELPRRRGARLVGICLAEEDAEARRLSVTALARWAKEGSAPAFRELRSLTRDALSPVRAAAAEPLAADAHLCSLSLLRELATDPSSLVRTAVSSSLGQRGKEEAESLLTRLAQDRVPAVRAAAVHSLAELGASEAVRAAARDRHPTVRAAAGALQARTPTDVELLLSLSGDRHAEVAQEATRALGRSAAEAGREGWERLVVIARQPALARAAAEGIAAALDSADLAAPQLRERLQGLSEHVLWGIARTAESPRAAEAARLLARLADAGEQIGDALGDMSVFLAAAGARRDAELWGWLAGCAEAVSVEDIGRALVHPPSGGGKVASRLAGIARAADQLSRASAGARREHHRQRGLALVEAMRLAPCQGGAWDIGLRIAESWGQVLREAAPAGADAEVLASVASARVIAGPRPRVLVRLENRGRAPARQIAVALGAETASARSLPPHGTDTLAVSLPPAQPGRTKVAGDVTFEGRTGGHSQALAGEVEVVAPGRLQSGDNPYVIGKPLRGDSPMFLGRAAELAFVERTLASGQQGGVAVLVGPRRSGKTSILKRLAAQLSGRYQPVFVDVQGILVSDTEAFFEDLARRLLAGDESKWMTSDGSLGSRWRGAEMVREAAVRVEGRSVLLLDEFDDLEQKVRAGRLGAEVFDQLRSLIQHTEALAFVLAGTHRLEELAGEYWSFLLNLATYQAVGPLAPEEAEQLIRIPLEGLGLACEEAAISTAVSLTGCQPYLLQLLGYRLVERCLESDEGGVHTGLVQAAAEEVIEQGEIHLRYLWESAGAEGQAVLSALADTGGWTSQAELQKLTGLRAARLARAAAALQSSHIIAQQTDWFCLRIGLLGGWARRRL